MTRTMLARPTQQKPQQNPRRSLATKPKKSKKKPKRSAFSVALRTAFGGGGGPPRFELDDQCPDPKCGKILSREEVLRGWSESTTNIRVACPSCGVPFKYTAQATIGEVSHDMDLLCPGQTAAALEPILQSLLDRKGKEEADVKPRQWRAHFLQALDKAAPSLSFEGDTTTGESVLASALFHFGGVSKWYRSHLAPIKALGVLLFSNVDRGNADLVDIPCDVELKIPKQVNKDLQSMAAKAIRASECFPAPCAMRKVGLSCRRCPVAQVCLRRRAKDR
jgi:hypothetical protein